MMTDDERCGAAFNDVAGTHKRRVHDCWEQALAECKDWNMLHNFANEKKPPIGYRPFAEVCLDHGEQHEALKYILRIRDQEERLEMLLQTRSGGGERGGGRGGRGGCGWRQAAVAGAGGPRQRVWSYRQRQQGRPAT